MNYEQILVTGCCGFIGYKVSELLLKQGIAVIGIDNLNDYYDPNLKKWRLRLLKEKGLEANIDFNFHKSDIGDFDSVKTIFSNYKIDAVINLAARAGVRASVEDPWTYLDTNLKGTLNLLECCRTNKIKKFFLASTSSLYGGASKIPFHVEDNTDRPLAPYSATKKAAEVLCYTYHYLYGIDISIGRYFTVYGPAGRPDMSIFKFIKNIDMGKPIPVFGDGKQKRDFTYIDDIAEGTLRCLNIKGYEIFNLGSDSPVELIYVINLIEEYLGKRAHINWLPMHPADIRATWADITKSKERLGWKPTTRIEEGIKKCISWYLENRDFVRGLMD